ncbi:MAG: FtsW/RodA/SpoVE family cell cycle protein, partial [Limnochordia bacterium]|nr:FtsW/RodA/SpoVE family cell cycle protein [Limnochordia bacterium]
MSSPRRNPDIVLFTVTCLLLVIGVVMVASASFVLGQELGDPFFCVKRQILWVLIGVCTMIVMMKIDYHTHFRWAFAGLLVSYVLLA